MGGTRYRPKNRYYTSMVILVKIWYKSSHPPMFCYASTILLMNLETLSAPLAFSFATMHE